MLKPLDAVRYVRRPKTVEEEAERFCGQMARREAKNFYWGFISLPHDQRVAIYSLYDFARQVDDDVDGAPSAHQIPARLAMQRERVRACYLPAVLGDEDGSDPVMRVLARAVQRYAIPQNELQSLIDGVERDCTCMRYQSWDSLREYCYLVASIVGRMCVRIFGFSDPAALERADDLGLALQLTNILRDVREDAEMGRIYLPAEDLRRFDISDEAMLRGKPGEGWNALVEFETRRARELFESGYQVLRYIPRRAGACVQTMGGIYEGILQKIERDPQTAVTPACIALKEREDSRGAGVVAKTRVAVVGAGLAGLAAAVELKDAGLHVELFERSRLLGGRATSFELDGHVVDNGQHVFLACCDRFIHFVQRVGMSDALYLQDRFDVVAYGKNGVRGRLRAANLPPPLHLLASFAGYRHLSMRGKFGIARALIALMIRPQSAREDASFADWLKMQGQSPDTIRSFWEPFMVPALNAPLERMNAAEAAFVISKAFLSSNEAARFGYSRVPLARIMDRAAMGLDRVHRSSSVLALEADADGILLRTAGEEQRFDAAVLAISPRALSRLLGEPERFGLPSLDGYEPFGIMDVHVWYDGERLDAQFAALLDSPVQWIFEKAPGYLCCSMSAADDLVARPSAEMVTLAWNEVRGAVPKLRNATLVRGAATRNPEGTYLAAPGVRRPGPSTSLPNLAIAGAWTATGWPDTMESAVRSGYSAARVLLGENNETYASLASLVCACLIIWDGPCNGFSTTSTRTGGGRTNSRRT